MTLLLLLVGAGTQGPPPPAVVCLTLDTRALGLTLDTRALGLTVAPRALALSLDARTLALTMQRRTVALTLDARPVCLLGVDMAVVTREVREGTQAQGESETLRYQITSTPWGVTPVIVGIVAKDMTLGGTDVSATVLSGVSGVSGDVMTLTALGSLTKNHLYRIEIQFTTADGSTWEAYFNVAATE